jgi:hypothetical protein
MDKILHCDSCCLIKSLTIKSLFNNLGISSRIELGITKRMNALYAHAYVVADEKHILLNKNGLMNLTMNKE